MAIASKFVKTQNTSDQGQTSGLGVCERSLLLGKNNKRNLGRMSEILSAQRKKPITCPTPSAIELRRLEFFSVYRPSRYIRWLYESTIRIEIGWIIDVW